MQRSPAPAPDVPPRPWTMRQIKLLAVLDALDRHGGDKPAAAAELGISLKSVYNILADADGERRRAS